MEQKKETINELEQLKKENAELKKQLEVEKLKAENKKLQEEIDEIRNPKPSVTLWWSSITLTPSMPYPPQPVQPYPQYPLPPQSPFTYATSPDHPMNKAIPC